MTLRMPMGSASRKGLSAVAAQAETENVVLTSHGRSVAVVAAPAAIEEMARVSREALLVMTDAFADRVSGRASAFDLEGACARLGVDPRRARERARELAEEAS